VSELAHIVARSMKGNASRHDSTDFWVLVIFGVLKFIYKLIRKRIKTRKKK
jgi:hypothetical protein